MKPTSPPAESEAIVRICYTRSPETGHLICYTADAPRALSPDERELLIAFFAYMQGYPLPQLPEELAGFLLVASGQTDTRIPYAQYRKLTPIRN